MTSDDAPHQVNNAKKMLAYYAKEREMLRKKLQRAERPGRPKTFGSRSR